MCKLLRNDEKTKVNVKDQDIKTGTYTNGTLREKEN
jgi:hypothetical protein